MKNKIFGAILYLSLALGLSTAAYASTEYQKEALGVTVSAVSMFGLIIIMVIKDMVQQLLENTDHLVVIQELV